MTVCATCGAAGAKKWCARCKHTHYCSRECQRSAWSAHKVLCGAARTSELLRPLDEVAFVFGPPSDLPGFGVSVQPTKVGNKVVNVNFYDRPGTRDELLGDLANKAVMVDGMLFAYLVAAANADTHAADGFCYTRGPFVDTSFAAYQEEVPVYYLAPDASTFEKISVGSIYCGQWLVRDGDAYLGMTDEGPVVMDVVEWHRWLVAKLVKDGTGTEGDTKAFARMLKDVFANIQFHLWPRGRVGDVNGGASTNPPLADVK